MQKGLKRLNKRDIVVCEESNTILNEIQEKETFFLNSKFIREREARNPYLQIFDEQINN